MERGDNVGLREDLEASYCPLYLNVDGHLFDIQGEVVGEGFLGLDVPFLDVSGGVSEIVLHIIVCMCLERLDIQNRVAVERKVLVTGTIERIKLQALQLPAIFSEHSPCKGSVWRRGENGKRSHWARELVEAMLGFGIIQGIQGDNIVPLTMTPFASRGEGSHEL